jgi:hypothetical protein
MYKKTITYEDYDGNTRTEDAYFNFNEAELADIQHSVPGGYAAMLDSIVKNEDSTGIVNVVKELIEKSYGIKSEDGRRFIKKPEYLEEFMETPAYGAFYMELISNENAFAEFINKILPTKLLETAKTAKIENSTVTNLPSKT